MPSQPELEALLNVNNDVYQQYLVAQTSRDRLAHAYNTTVAYGQFDEGRDFMPQFVDTGPIFCGAPGALKRFRQVTFGGNGKLYIRAIVDNKEAATGYVILSEGPAQANIFRLPRGTAGYAIQLQISGLGWWRFFEIDFDPIGAGNENV